MSPENTDRLDDFVDQLNERDMNNVRIGFNLATSMFLLSTSLADGEDHGDALALMREVLGGKVCDTKENMKRYQRLLLNTTTDLLEVMDRLKRSEKS